MPNITLLNKRGGHWYDVEGLGVLPSVTTVLSATIPKPALVNWAKKMALESVKTALLGQGCPPSDDPATWAVYVDSVLAKAKTEPRRAMEEAAGLGTRAHRAIELIIKGDTPLIAPDIRPCVDGFLSWREESGIDIEFSERQVYSAEHRTAGSIDCIGKRRRDGARVLADWKTSKGIYNEHAYQVAGGYALCWEELNTERVREAWVIRLPKTEADAAIKPFEAKKVSNIEDARQMFALCRRMFDGLKLDMFLEN